MMPYSWQDCAAGGAAGNPYMDFGSIGVGEATAEELKTFCVEEASFAVAVLNLDAQAAFILEGQIGDNWFSLPSTQIIVAPVDDPTVNKATGVLVYDHCASISALRCRFLSAGAGSLVPVADVVAMGVTINHR